VLEEEGEEIDEDLLYKGWVAVPHEEPKPKFNLFQRSKSKYKPEVWSEDKRGRKKSMIRRVLSPIGSLFTCRSCRSAVNNDRRAHVSPEERLGYKGISLDANR
jgi:hypothetical protein